MIIHLSVDLTDVHAPPEMIFFFADGNDLAQVTTRQNVIGENLHDLLVILVR